MKRIVMGLLSTLAFASFAYAGECKMHILRTACTGQEAESYKKCEGKKECDEVKRVGTADACKNEALKACDNVGGRQKITKSKEITATFNGTAIDAGKNFCDAKREDFNKCDK